MGRSKHKRRGEDQKGGGRVPDVGNAEALALSDNESDESSFQRFETHFETTLTQRIMG